MTHKPHKKPNILISCLHTNTPLCLALGSHLETNFNRKSFFISDDCPSSPLLPAGSLVLSEMNATKPLTSMADAEVTALYEYIYKRDRFLKKRLSRVGAFTLFNAWSELIQDYLHKNDIGIVVMEGTPAYELILEFCARRLNLKVVCPAQIVWGKETGSVLYTASTWSDAYRLKDKQLHGIKTSAPTPDSIFDCNDSYPGIAKRVKNFLAHRSLNAPTRWAQVLEAIRKKVVGALLAHFNDDAKLKNIKGEIVTYFLHVDPEKSVDNSGSDIWPQMAVITDLQSKLPPDVTLIVRDHPLIRGKRKLKDVLAIRGLRNTLYVSGQCDRNILIERSKFVATISGSVALESAARGARVIVYGRPIFLHHPNVWHISQISDFREFAHIKFNVEENNAQFAKYIEPRLAKFVFGDIHLMSSAMNSQNISNLANAILDAEQLGWTSS